MTDRERYDKKELEKEKDYYGIGSWVLLSIMVAFIILVIKCISK